MTRLTKDNVTDWTYEGHRALGYRMESEGALDVDFGPAGTWFVEPDGRLSGLSDWATYDPIETPASDSNLFAVISTGTKPGFNFIPNRTYLEDEAFETADRLARIHPGLNFFIVQVVAHKVVTASPPPVETTIF